MLKDSLSLLFEDRPRQWGLRGDPLLWDEMQESMQNLDWPATMVELQTLLEAHFFQLTGFSCRHHEPFFIKRFDRGGLSSGQISPEFWRSQAFPLILNTFNRIKAKEKT